jgi:hypothetical protein
MAAYHRMDLSIQFIKEEMGERTWEISIITSITGRIRTSIIQAPKETVRVRPAVTC